MYEKDTSEQQASMWGLSLTEIPPEEVMVWDINWPAFSVFNTLATQWRGTSSGLYGLDYNTIIPIAKLMGFKKKEIKDMFPDIQVMENEALITMGENRENDDNR